MTYSKKGQKPIKNTLSYYPFGLQQKGYNYGVSGNANSMAERFNYLGQEEQPELGLNWLTFRYRNYMPEIGRFFGSDPIAEQFFSISNYQFAHNTPVWKIELEGLEGKSTNDVPETVTHETIKMVPQSEPSQAFVPVVTTMVVETTATEVAEKSIGSRIFGAASRTVGLFLGLFLTDSMSPNVPKDEIPPSQWGVGSENIPFQAIDQSGIDEKHQLDDGEINAEGESSSPINRIGNFELLHSEDLITGSAGYDEIQNLSDSDLIESVTNPKNGDFVTVNPITGKIIDGNTRVFEIRRRGLEVDIPYREHNPNNSDYFYDIDD